MRSMSWLAAILVAGVCPVLPSALAADAGTAPSRLRLESPGLQLELSPRLGGRVLHFSLPGAPNLKPFRLSSVKSRMKLISWSLR